jgi:hypothetical protein
MKQAFVEPGRGHIIFTLPSWLQREQQPSPRDAGFRYAVWQKKKAGTLPFRPSSICLNITASTSVVSVGDKFNVLSMIDATENSSC